MIELFDTHFHWDEKTEPAVIYNDAVKNLVSYLVCVGGDIESSKKSMHFAEIIEKAYFTVGVHPHYADNFKENINEIKQLLKHPKLAAIGEIGLDYYYNNSDKKKQVEVFNYFLEQAVNNFLPIVIHCRDKEENFDAYQEVYNLLKNMGNKLPPFVLHCYTGNGFWIDKFLELGAYIGITGIVTFPKAENVRELLNFIPDDKLLIETDSPYLAPKPYRGKTNHPKYLIEIAKAISIIKNISLGNLADLTTKNAIKFYRIESR